MNVYYRRDIGILNGVVRRAQGSQQIGSGASHRAGRPLTETHHIDGSRDQAEGIRRIAIQSNL